MSILNQMFPVLNQMSLPHNIPNNIMVIWMSIVTVIACLISVLIIPRNSPRLWKKHKQGISSIYIQLQLQLQSGYLVTSASRHLTKDYIYTLTQQSLKV